jgi:ABC-type amino acid transport substrate-binding protein
MNSLCGLTVSAVRGTLQIDLMSEFSKENCGSDQINIPLLNSPADAILQVQTQRADAYMADAVVAQELATQSSKNSAAELDVVAFPKIQLPPAGMPVALDNKELQNVLVKAWDKIIASGEYSEILGKWHVEVLAVDKATINAGSN